MYDTSLENPARTVDAGPLRIVRSVVVPMLRPPMLYAGLLIFGTAVETLSIPLVLGEPADITLPLPTPPLQRPAATRGAGPRHRLLPRRPPPRATLQP
ncbi:hypothetical protein [Streptomyces sp. NPDC059460]|uniref:hypothetical protein n=1 Tax=Streptomyces sp. NPDC059460 TaxID=3346840 RepID=UPI0036B9A8D2